MPPDENHHWQQQAWLIHGQQQIKCTPQNPVAQALNANADD